MSFAILGIGTAVPPNVFTQTEAAETAKRICCRTEEDASILATLYRHTGVQSRHMVFHDNVVRAVMTGDTITEDVNGDGPFLPTGEADDLGPGTAERMKRYAQEAPPLSEQATRRALEDAGVSPRDITHLITVSCTGFGAPGFDVGLFRRLGLAATVERVHVGFMGCHGALNGLKVARAFAANPDARILLCALELCSLHFHYAWDPKKVVANALFADGAGAVVVGAATEASPDNWRLTATGSCLIPNSEYAMTWNIGDHGFEMTLSARVPSLIGEHLRPWLESWLRENGIALTDVASWAIHPGGPRILTSVEQPLGLDERATAVSREVLAEFGNMSSPTVLFILERLRQRNAPRPCVALGFGPGLVAEAALFV